MNVPETIETERLRLRPHQHPDLSAFTRFMGDEQATKYLAFEDEQKTSKGANAMLTFVIDSYATDAPICSLTIADPQTNEYLGSCGVSPHEDGRTAEIYVTVLPDYQGRGYACEAIRALIEHVRTTTNFRELVADIVIENRPSVRVFEKCGFSDAGPIRRGPVPGAMGHEPMTGRRYSLSLRE